MYYKDCCWFPLGYQIVPEAQVHPHVVQEKPHLFESVDGGSTEIEMLNFLHSTIRLTKPSLILETGSYLGIGTLAIANACKLNGFGKVVSLEFDTNYYNFAKKIIQKEGLEEWVELINGDTLKYLKETHYTFDLGFFDSENDIRGIECEICLQRNILKKTAVFHDTSRYRDSIHGVKCSEKQQKYREKIFELSRYPTCTGYIESNLSRGFMMLSFNSDNDISPLPEKAQIIASPNFKPDTKIKAGIC